ncbi:MAG: hypothetical protein HZA10_08900 [Nitrospirae bacterium]|nr:hypothetical protein [Nitrospirota bacterium]
MNEQINNELPAHLRELVSPTPSGFAKLIAAWAGLDTETQILLHMIKQLRKSGRHYFDKTFLTVALKSPNPYVRYLAAKEFHPYATEEINQLIENDPDPLVRFCKKEDTWDFILSDEFKDSKAFFEMPQEARLASVRSLRGGGEEIAQIISYAVDHELEKGAVTENELLEILADYVNRSEFKDYYKEDIFRYDGWGEYQQGKDIESLWNLLLKVPESISYILIWHLPPEAGLFTGIPDSVLKNMTNSQLRELLYRSDVELTKFRKEVFLKTDTDDFLNSAAVAYNFNLTNDEFAEILKKPENEKYKILNNLKYAQDLSLCLHDALHDILFNGPRFEDAEWPGRILEQKLKSLKSGENGQQLRELRLYRLAKQTVPWKKEKGYLPSNELNFLRNAVVEGDTWETFMSFSKAWEQNRSTQKLEEYLPLIHELDEDNRVDEEDFEDSSQITKRLEEKLSELSSKLRTDSDGKDTTLADAFSQVTAYLTVLQDKTKEELDFLKNQLSGLQNSFNRQKILSVTIFVLAVILLFLLWK